MGRHTHKGFTLVEMAFVVVVMGLILLAVLPTLSTMTYAVDTNLTQNFGIVPPTRPCTSAEMTNNPTQCRSSNHAQNGLCRSNLPPSGNMRVMQTMGSATDTDVAVLLLSHGKNGYGAFQASASSETTLIRRLSFPPPPNSTVCSDGGVEQCNGQGGDNGLYYDRDHVSNAGDVFDDVLLYYDRNQLVALLGGAACQTSWGAP
ncbi:MAG: type II secretion system protein [Alphaproteobacteria bacterium]|nr:type II secretion system protein [Alphaproteobacteria bacterium]